MQVGVEIDDHHGGAYRYERGNMEFTGYSRLEVHNEDKDGAVESFANTVDKETLNHDDRVIKGKEIEDIFGDDPCAAREDCDARSAAGSRRYSASVAPALNHSGVFAPGEVMEINETQLAQLTDEPDQSYQRLAMERCGSEANFSSCSRERPRPGPNLPTRMRSQSQCQSIAGKTSRAPSSVGTSPAKNDCDDEDGRTVCSDSLQDGQGNEMQPQKVAAKGRRQDERDLEDAQKCFEKACQDFGPDNHLDRSRQFAACTSSVDKLRKWGRKLSRSKSEPNRQYGQQLFDCADEVEERQAIFDESRDDFISAVVSPLSRSREAVVRTLSDSTLAALVAREAPKASEAGLGCSLAGKALHASLVGKSGPAEDRPKGIGLWLVQDGVLVKTTQRQVVHSHLEKILKEPSPAGLHNATLRFLGETSMAAMSPGEIAKVLDLKVTAKPDTTSPDGMINGFCSQLWADMASVWGMGMVCKHQASDSRVPGNWVIALKALVANRTKLSGRVRSFQKHIGGVSHTSRDAWTRMIDISEATTAVCSVTVDEMQVWTKKFRTARTGPGGEVTELLCVLGEHVMDAEVEPKLQELAKWHRYAKESNDDAQPDELAAAGDLMTELLECVGAICEAANYFADVFVPYQRAESDTLVLPDDGTTAAAGAVLNKEYFDEPDNLPDSVAMLSVVGSCSELCSKFHGTSTQTAIIKDTMSRAWMGFQCWQLSRYTIHKGHSAFDQLRLLADMSKNFTFQAKAGVDLKASSNACIGLKNMQIFVDKAITSDFVPLSIREQIADMIGASDVTLPGLRRELAAHIELNVPDLLASVKIMDDLERLADAVVKGGATRPTLTQVNDALHMFVSEMPQSLTNRRGSVVKAKELLGTDFGVTFGVFESRVNRTVASCVLLDKKASGIYAAIDSWNFDACKFVTLHKDKPDSSVINASRTIESSSQNFCNWRQVVAALSEKCKHQPNSIKEKVAKMKSIFDDGSIEMALKGCRRMIAHCSLVNCILTSATPATESTWPSVCAKMLAHAKGPLSLADTDFHGDFLQQITSDARAPGKKRISGASAASSAAASTASTAAPSSIAASSCSSGIEQKKKKTKFRRTAASAAE